MYEKMTFYIAQLRQDFLCLLRHILQFSPQTRQKAGSDSAPKTELYSQA